MILSEKQKRIISSVQLQANSSVAQIAEETGYRPHVVRYALEFLKDRRILTPYVCVDLTRLGLHDHCAYFSYLCETEVERQKLLNFLIQSPEVTVVSEFAGEYQYNAAPYVQNFEQVAEFFNRITAVCRGELLNKAVASRVRWALFRPKFFSAHAAQVNCLAFGSSNHEKQTLDQTDLDILWHLTQPEFPTPAQVSRSLKLPSSSVEDRVRRLEEKRVICGYAYHLNTGACGIQTFRLLVYQKHPSDLFSDQIFEFAKNHPHITSFVHCIGNWDYELGIRTEQGDQALAVVQELYSRFREQIGSVKLLSILSRRKFNLFPFAKGNLPFVK